jgi:GNAT superfamily N-acetyltransferase
MAEIREASIDDAHKLALLLRDIGWFETFNSGDIDRSTERVRARLEQCLADNSHLVLVAIDANHKIAAYAAVHWLPYLFMSGPEGYVSELFVSEAARGRGIGRELLAAVEKAGRARGCERLSLINLRHRESYQRRFYIKAGWRERSEAANFIYSLPR